MQDTFYLRLEERFRGSEQQIAQRLLQYVPVLESLEQAGQVVALDLGCGRGEWLSLLTERHWQVSGIDLNASMVERCNKQGLKVRQQDALSCLKALPDESKSLISGFHIAEHMAFDELLEMIGEAHRVLLPEGVLLLETPNPENLHVGAHTFYMDPSHRHPLPPQLLQFAIQEQGFARVDIRRLNGGARPQNTMAFGDQIEWFLDANLDYVVIAQKCVKVFPGQILPGQLPLAQALEKIGEANFHHIEFYGMAREYVEQTHQRIAKVAQNYQRITHEQQGQIQALQSMVGDLQGTLGQINESGFMRIVAGLNRLRRLGIYTRHHGLAAAAQLIIKKVGSGLATHIRVRPRLHKAILQAVRKFPCTRQWLKSLVSEPQPQPDVSPAIDPPRQDTDINSPRAGEILRDLNQSRS